MSEIIIAKSNFPSYSMLFYSLLTLIITPLNYKNNMKAILSLKSLQTKWTHLKMFENMETLLRNMECQDTFSISQDTIRFERQNLGSVLNVLISDSVKRHNC